MYYDGCKYGKCGNGDINKFKLDKSGFEKEQNLKSKLNLLSDIISPLYARVAPDSFNNMNEYSHIAKDCRIGDMQNFQPWSGVTAVSKF